MIKLKILLFLLILSTLSFYLYYREGSLPVNKKSEINKLFVVEQGEGLNSIVNKLNQEGLIRNRVIFYLIVKKLGIERKIQAGEFQLSPGMNAIEIATYLTHGTSDTSITLIEGMRKEEMAEIISKALDIPGIEVTQKTNEGYIFPDTYSIQKNATFDNLFSIIKNNTKFIELLKIIPQKTKLTEKEVMILASLVEREARQPATREKIAGIIFKRYQADWPLQIDASVQYILGYQPNEKSWWKKELTEENLKIESPYNTYKHPGLPPEPICSPSLSSIEAVINADPNTPYWYYITDPDGVMHYAVTLEDHEANIQKYLR